MLTFFRSLSQKFPRLKALASDGFILSASSALGAYVTYNIKDPIEREVAWNNFLDIDGYKAELSKRQKEIRKQKT